MQFFIPVSSRKRTRVLDDDEFTVLDNNLEDEKGTTEDVFHPSILVIPSSASGDSTDAAQPAVGVRQQNESVNGIKGLSHPPYTDIDENQNRKVLLSQNTSRSPTKDVVKGDSYSGTEKSNDLSRFKGSVVFGTFNPFHAGPPPPLSAYPSVPYYSLGNTLEIYIGTRDGFSSNVLHTNNSSNTPTKASTSSSNSLNVSFIHSELQKTVKLHGSIWFLTTSSLTTDSFLSRPVTQPLQVTVERHRGGGRSREGSVGLSYDQLSDAMTSAIQSMAHVRHKTGEAWKDHQRTHETPAPVSPHCIFLRILGHSQWKDIMAMLGVENGRLILFVAASSRPTQQHITHSAVEAGVSTQEMTWVAGAILVTEPAPSGGAGQENGMSAHAVMTVWSVLTFMLARPPTLTGPSASSASTYERVIIDPLSPSTLTPDQSVRQSTGLTDIEHWLGAGCVDIGKMANVTLISSLALPHAQQYTPELRLVETQPITLAHPRDSAVHSSETSTSPYKEEGNDSNASQRGLSSLALTKKKYIAGYRYVWRLVGSVVVVHPLLLTHMIHALVHRCRLRSFDLRLASATSPTSNTGAPGALSLVGGAGGTASVSGGFTYVHGALQQSSSTARGSSLASSWQCCSRLSAHAWLSEAEREQLGMVVEEEGEKINLEGEFSISRICFKDVLFPEMKLKREGNAPISPSPSHECSNDHTNDLFRTHLWPTSFQIWKSVTRIIDEPDNADVVF